MQLIKAVFICLGALAVFLAVSFGVCAIVPVLMWALGVGL